MTYVMGREGREKFTPNSYSPNSAEPLSSPDSPSVLLPFFHPPQQFQTSSIPLTCPVQSHTVSPLSSYSCHLEKRSTSLRPSISQPGLLPLLLPSTRRPRLFSPLRLYSSSIPPSQESLLSNLYFTPDSLSPAFKHISSEALLRCDDFFSQFLINPKR